MNGEHDEDEDDLTEYDVARYRQFIDGSFDVYLPTLGGSFRRVTVSSDFWMRTAWLMQTESDLEPEFFDEWVNEKAQLDGCGYTEALNRLLEIVFERTELYANFSRDRDNEVKMDALEKAFEEEQRRRELAWRTTNGEWSPVLTPTTD